MSRPIQIVPSMLPADYSRLGEQVAMLEAAGADMVQWDVMDGQYVPNITVGPTVIRSTRPYASLPFEAHLMVNTPDVLAHEYVDAGVHRLIVHVESTTHIHRTLTKIGELGMSAAVGLNPSTPANAVEYLLDLVDLVLVMTVNPGFGGQSYLPAMEGKIAAVREMIERAGYGDRIDIEVDGGIGTSTIGRAVKAGANVLVAGSAVFTDPEGPAHAIAELRRLAEEARR